MMVYLNYDINSILNLNFDSNINFIQFKYLTWFNFNWIFKNRDPDGDVCMAGLMCSRNVCTIETGMIDHSDNDDINAISVSS